MNKKDDGDFKDDIKSLLKKLHELEEKLSQLPPFLPARDSGLGETNRVKKISHPLAPVFSGNILRKSRSIKKGFITWPSEEDKPAIPTDRVSYVINRWESHTSNSKADDLFSEPSDFVDLSTSGFVMGDRRKDGNLNGLSIKESKACVVSKIKNSELKS